MSSIASLLRNPFSKNISWTLLGYVIPLIAAVLLIPQTLNNVGKESYGLLALASVLVGFSGVFDLGLGRSLTYNLVRSRLPGLEADYKSFYTTGLLLLTALGIVAGTVIWSLRHWLASLFLQDAPGQHAVLALGLVGAAIPLVLVQTAGLSVLEAAAKFKQVALLKSFVSTSIFALPFLASLYTSSPAVLVAALVLARLSGALIGTAAAAREIYIFVGQSVLKNLRRSISRSHSKQLLAYGSWVALSNVIGAILTRFDVIIIGAILGASAVATYFAAVEVIAKIGVVSSSIGLVLFTKLSQEIDARPAVAKRYFQGALGLTVLLLAPVCLVIAYFSKEIMSLWLQQSYSSDVAFVTSVFAIGYLIHGVGQPAYVWLQAQGRPRIPATIHMVELVIYAISMPWLIMHYGIRGAALGWAGRVALSVIALHIVRAQLIGAKKYEL